MGARQGQLQQQRPRSCSSSQAGSGSDASCSGATCSGSGDLNEAASSSCDSADFGRASRAQPQLVDGDLVWPERWGLAHGQIRELLSRLRRDPGWSSENNVYALVEDFVVPWTRGYGLGYALLANQGAPQEVNVMVSHAFAENAENFLEAVLRATTERDVVYICALSNYQAEDGAGPSVAEQLGHIPAESPFRRVLENITARGREAGCRWRWRRVITRFPAVVLLCAMLVLCTAVVATPTPQVLHVDEPADEDRFDHVRQILLAAACLATAAGFLHCWVARWHPFCSGRMVVVPNHQLDIYTRLWCVYEIFVAKTTGLNIVLAPTLAPAGKASSQYATCSNEQDLLRIRAELAPYGYERIDEAVRQTMRGRRWHTAMVFVKYVLLQCVPFRAHCALGHDHLGLIGTAYLPMSLFYAGLTATGYGLAAWNQGVFQARPIFVFAAFGAVAAELVFSIATKVTNFYQTYWWADCMKALLLEIASFSVVFLAALQTPSPKCFRADCRLRSTMALFVFVYINTTVWTVVVARHCQISIVHTRTILDSLLLAWTEICPLYMVWTESVYLGIKVDGGDCLWPRAKNAASSLAVAMFVFGKMHVECWIWRGRMARFWKPWTG